MDKVKVIFRKTKENEIVAFFPEIRANSGNIMSYMHIGQHDEAGIFFYYNTKKATPEEYKALLNELKGIYNDCELVVKQKICYKDLQNAWKE